MMLNACYRVIATESAINSESFRESLSTERYQPFESSTLRENEASDRKSTADPCARFGAGSGRDIEDDVVVIASSVINRENGTVAAHHATPLRKLSGNRS